MKETALWQLIRRNNPQVFFTRLESGSTALGIPDVVGIANGKTAFLELKNGDNPSKWTAFQERWHEECKRHGGLYFLVFGHDDGHLGIQYRSAVGWWDIWIPKGDWSKFGSTIWG